MYGKLPKIVAQCGGLSMGAKVLYAMLQMHKNPKSGKCNPSQRTLAHECATTQPSVHRWIGQLSALGLLAYVEGNYIFPSDTPAYQSDTPTNQSDTPANHAYNVEEKKRKRVQEGSVDESAQMLLEKWDKQFPKTLSKRNQQHRIYDQNCLVQLLREGKTVAQVCAIYDHIDQNNLTKFFWRPYRLADHMDQGRGPLVFDKLDSERQEEEERSKKTPQSKKINKTGTPMADMATEILAEMEVAL